MTLYERRLKLRQDIRKVLNEHAGYEAISEELTLYPDFAWESRISIFYSVERHKAAKGRQTVATPEERKLARTFDAVLDLLADYRAEKDRFPDDGTQFRADIPELSDVIDDVVSLEDAAKEIPVGLTDTIAAIEDRMTGLERAPAGEDGFAYRDSDIKDLDRRVTELHEAYAELSSGGGQPAPFAVPVVGGVQLAVASLLGILLGVVLFFVVAPAHAGANSMQSNSWSLEWACENRQEFSDEGQKRLEQLCAELVEG